MYIGTNDREIRFGDWNYVMRQPNTRCCVEQVSDEMFNAMMKFAQDDLHKNTISYLLYDILEEKWLSTN